jgi:hypothetical protein
MNALETSFSVARQVRGVRTKIAVEGERFALHGGYGDAGNDLEELNLG